MECLLPENHLKNNNIFLAIASMLFHLNINNLTAQDH